jgi:hypothetical protein
LKKILLVARDAAPSGAFNLLIPALRKKGYYVTLILGEGKEIPDSLHEITQLVTNADIVILGMSSSRELANKEIFAASIAQKAKIPFGFYGDVPDCYQRAREGAWFEPFANDAAFYFGINEADAEAAKQIFANAKVFGTGNPLREQAAFPKFSRGELRAKLQIPEDTIVVLAPGGKFAAANATTWTLVMDAIVFLKSEMEKDFQLLITMHPGDPVLGSLKTNGEPLGLYEELISYSPVPVRMVTKAEFSTTELVPTADLVVEFGSAIGIDAAYQQIPVVSLGFSIWENYFEKFSGKKTIEAVEAGISILANPDSLKEIMHKLLIGFGSEELKQQQQKMYPKPAEKHMAVKAMTAALLQMFGKPE